MGLSSSSLKKTETKSNPALAKPTLNGIRPAQLLALPPLLFAFRSHFAIENTTVTRPSENVDSKGPFSNSSVLLNTPISQGIVSVTLTILTLPKTTSFGVLRFCLLDSTAPVPKLRETVGCDIQDSVSLYSNNGRLYFNTPSTRHQSRYESCHPGLYEGDCVRMEVDMESMPRTLQFFVNGESGRCFVSGLPPSVRIGFSVSSRRTSFRIDRIVEQTQPTPTLQYMHEIEVAPLQIRPSLFSKNLRHFFLRNTTITHSPLGQNSFNSDYTLLLKEKITSGVVSMTLTLLCQRGAINFGLIDSNTPVPKLGDAVGSDVENSVSLYSCYGLLYHNTPSTSHEIDVKYCHSVLREGDCVRMEVDMESTPRTVQFFVNGETGQCFVSGLPPSVRVGFSAYAQESSFRIDRISKQEKPTPITPEMEEIKW
ncbi:hypothetical protein BLNAU_17260 [Blattamonas nauphoetae]|uniref:B30.2/SPRY domain-containing protein n=1 Tax=Blattamonas nauphoetae TaxID=2049346 RepID=A0ABQ9X961_9EUKA|nr:hypothetical protein BLNAU_17260 [Blattamonas nauphoetae]